MKFSLWCPALGQDERDARTIDAPNANAAAVVAHTELCEASGMWTNEEYVVVRPDGVRLRVRVEERRYTVATILKGKADAKARLCVVCRAPAELLANGRPLCRQHGEGAAMLNVFGLIELSRIDP